MDIFQVYLHERDGSKRMILNLKKKLAFLLTKNISKWDPSVML